MVVTEQSWGCKVQHREYSSQKTYLYDPWAWTNVCGSSEGMGEGLGGGSKGGKVGTTLIAQIIKYN